MPSRIRDHRQAEILDAALTEIRANGVTAMTMSRLAQLTGLSRPAIYQYFSSREHVLAELLIDDLADLVNEIDCHVCEITDPVERIRVWVNRSLMHLANGDHSIIREISESSLPDESREVVRVLHGQFMMSLISPVRELGIEGIDSACHMIYSAVQSAAKRIEAGFEFNAEAKAAENFAIAGLLGIQKNRQEK
jgi:AcrR family transcriptional regulator